MPTHKQRDKADYVFKMIKHLYFSTEVFGLHTHRLELENDCILIVDTLLGISYRVEYKNYGIVFYARLSVESFRDGSWVALIEKAYHKELEKDRQIAQRKWEPLDEQD